MNTKEFGQITERKFALECAKLNITISQPIGDSAPYDFIIEINGRLLKVQCKSLRKDVKRYISETHRKTGHQRKNKVLYKDLIDYFFLYNLEDDVFAFISVDECKETTTFSDKNRRLSDYSEIIVKDSKEVIGYENADRMEHHAG